MSDCRLHKAAAAQIGCTDCKEFCRKAISVKDRPNLIRHPILAGNWILIADYVCDDGTIIPRGFVTDFASVPKFLWWFISPTDLGDGPVEHDWKYRNGIGTRLQIDDKFTVDMVRDNVGVWKRRAAYYGVRVFGSGAWNSGEIIIEELTYSYLQEAQEVTV